MLDTPSQIGAFHNLQLYHALKLEVETGMRFSRRGSILATVNRKFGTSFRRKPDALVYMKEVIERDRVSADLPDPA